MNPKRRRTCRQDPLAWWLCDLSTTLCLGAGRAAARWGFFQDFVASTVYFADVVRFEALDSDFVGAHRLCAFFMSYELGFALALAALAAMLLPSVVVAIGEIFTGALVLLVQAASAESA